jgi:hypothetical protein
LLARELPPRAEFYAFLFGFRDAGELPLGADLGLELCDRSEHIEKQPTGGVSRVDVLIDDAQLYSFAFQFIGDLAQMQSRARQPVEPRDN